MRPKFKLAWHRLWYGIFCALVALVLASELQPKFHQNKDALAVLVNVFAILAGFMIAVFALAGDTRTLKGRNWREDTYYLHHIKNELIRYRILFSIYLSILASSFIVQVGPAWPPWLIQGLEYFVLAASMFALLVSFQLPILLTRRQIKMLNEEIERRKTSDNINRSKDS